MFYSQQEEDKILYNKYLNYKNGFFIELGAMNGIVFSNTLFFEQELNWSGVLIEPDPYQYYQLQNNRPNCHTFNYAISDKEGEVEFLGDQALGGIVSSMSEKHISGWKLDMSKSYLVKSKPIKSLIQDIPIQRVDLFSIDVEGGEYGVLSTFDWSIPVYLVLIELDGLNQTKDDQCRSFLQSNNFVLAEKIGINDLWINHNNKR